MKTEYLNSPEMRKVYLRHAEHELTICRGDNAADNLKTSLAHARALLESRRFDAVVYVNLPFTPRRFTDARRDVFPKSDNNPAFVVLHNHIGRLGPDFGTVEDAVKNAKGKTAVILNSWEFASSSYRYKEQLLFALHSLVCADDITVFLYSQAKAGSIVAGEIHRSGLGRLAAFAVGVMEFPEEKERFEEPPLRSMGVPPALPEAKPVYAEHILPSKKRESVQPSSSKIKELRYADLVKEPALKEMAAAA